MSINYFRQYELRNRDIVTLAPAHEVNGISIKSKMYKSKRITPKINPDEIDHPGLINAGMFAGEKFISVVSAVFVLPVFCRGISRFASGLV